MALGSRSALRGEEEEQGWLAAASLVHFRDSIPSRAGRQAVRRHFYKIFFKLPVINRYVIGDIQDCKNVNFNKHARILRS
jgi:hypothetical protein